jgi:hypothetical protein
MVLQSLAGLPAFLESGPVNETKNSDDDFEPRTDLNQPVGCLPVLTAN